MIRRVVGSTMVLAVVLMAGESMFAAPLTGLHVPVHAKMGRQKDIVKFHLRNDCKEPVTVKAGAQEMTLEPGKPVDVKLKVGETVSVARSTPKYQEGTVLTTVTQDLSDTTLALH